MAQKCKLKESHGESLIPSWYFLSKERGGKEVRAKNREKMTSSGCFQVDNNIDQKLHGRRHDPTHLLFFFFLHLRFELSGMSMQRKCNSHPLSDPSKSNCWLHFIVYSFLIAYQKSLMFWFVPHFESKNKKAYFLSINCQMWYIALKTDPNCHILYVTASRYFSVHYRLDFNNLQHCILLLLLLWI